MTEIDKANLEQLNKEIAKSEQVKLDALNHYQKISKHLSELEERRRKIMKENNTDNVSSNKEVSTEA